MMVVSASYFIGAAYFALGLGIVHGEGVGMAVFGGLCLVFSIAAFIRSTFP